MEQQASTEIPSYTPEEEKLIIRNKAGVPVGVKPHVKMTWKKILLWVLITALGPTPVATDDIVLHTGLKSSVVSVLLLELDLAGRIEHHGNQLISLIG